MRDSTGAVAALRVIAYDANNTPISGLATSFFVTDTAKTAHIANASFLVGDKQGSIHVIGQVTGVQTMPATVQVTVAPTTLALAGTIPDTIFGTIAGDTAQSIANQAIGVTLKGKGDTASLGFVVKYDLKYAPATRTGSTTPAVFIGADASKPMSVDTTDASGASRSIITRSFLLADQQLAAGQKADSIVLLISTSYKGVLVGGSPLRVVRPFKVKLSIQ